MNLPPSMTRGELKDYLMQGLHGPDRDVFEPTAERIVKDIFAAETRPRSIITPRAMMLARRALLALEAV